MMLNPLQSKGGGSTVRAMEDMGHFLIGSLTKGTLGVRLILPMEELVPNTNTSRGKLPSPSPKSKWEAFDGLKAWSPVHIFAGGDWKVVMGFPVAVDSRLEKSIVAVLPIERWLF